MDETAQEMDVPIDEPAYRLVSRDLLRTLMKRTGTGKPITVRELADAIGVAHGTVDNLRNGKLDRLPASKAHAAARRIGVDLLVLWEPVGRATGESEPSALQAVPA